jgi:N6-L-threonylcarbamoyladenine synthase
MYILGIESSCDDTSMAVIEKSTGQIIAIKTISQNDIHSKYQGIVPSLAAMGHLYSIEEVWKSIQNMVPQLEKNLAIIAVTNGPGLTGSLLIGINFAQGLQRNIQDTHNIPVQLVLCDHIEGHLLINLCHQWVDFPFLGVILSGGHTMVVHCKSLGQYQVFSTTLDDAVGECLDKCGRFLHLPYPGGIYLEQAALEGKNMVPLPVPMMKNTSNNFSFSGLKTAVFNIKDDYSPQDLSYTIQHVIGKSLKKVIQKAVDHYQCNTIVVGGGVISNKFFRQYLMENIGAQWYFPGPGLSTDSGAIPAAVAWVHYKFNQIHQLIPASINVYNNIKLNKKFHFLD